VAQDDLNGPQIVPHLQHVGCTAVAKRVRRDVLLDSGALDRLVQSVMDGVPWQTADPFLITMHHLDSYPAGDERMGPRTAGSRP
jgi:hypothetical protein